MKKLIALSLIAIFVLSLGGTVLADDPVNSQDLPNSGWWTSFTLQNPGSSGAANFTVQAKDGVDVYNAVDCSVGAGASVIYNPNATPNIGDNPPGTRIGFAGTSCGSSTEADLVKDNFQGAAVVNSDLPLVSVVSVGNNPTGTGGVAGGTASAFYQGFDGAKTDTTLLFPVAKNSFFGQSTTFYVQAVEDAEVTITYANNNESQTATILAGETHVFNPGDASVPVDTNTSATVTSTSGKIAGAVVEHPVNTTNPSTFALSTRAFVPSEADTTLYLPALKNSFFGGTTGAAIQAVGGDVVVEVNFSVTSKDTTSTCTAGTVSNISIAEGTSELIGGGGDFNVGTFTNGCFGSASVTVTSGTGKIVATVNETSNSGKAVYSGFPASAASQTVAVPLVKESFFNGNTAIVVQAVGDSATSTTITANYVNANACAGGCIIKPNGGGAGGPTTNGGSAVNFRRVTTDFSTQYLDGNDQVGPGNLASGTNNAVVVTSTTLPVVAVAQETVTGLDVKNYEGFAQ